MASSFFMLKIIERKRSARLNRHSVKDVKKSERNCKTTKPSDVVLLHKCRVCLKEGNIPIYGNESAPELLEHIKIIGDIEIFENDGLPQFICDTCLSLLQSALRFRKTAKESDDFLRKKTQNVSLPLHSETDHSIEFSDNDARDPYPEEKSYNCKLCKIKFQSSDELIIHKSSKQHRNVRIQCPICSRLLTVHQYERHLARHQSASRLICEVCGKMYRKDNLVRHLQLHSHELPFRCQTCPYRGRFMESLKNHMRTHTGDKPFSCDTCPLRFLTRSNLNRHLLTHNKDRFGEHNRPHKCIECSRGFYTKRDLNIHFISDHSGVKDHACKTCGNKYGTRKAMMRHELRVHKRKKMAKGRIPLYLQEEYIEKHLNSHEDINKSN